MIGFRAYQSTPTTLDLNGPILSYTTQPVGLTTESSSINLVGIATALPEGGTGDIAYQWYEIGHGPIASGSTITGTGTTTLTLNELNFNDSGREFFLEASYTSSAYQTSSPVLIAGRLLDTQVRSAAGIGTTVFNLSSLVGIVTVGDQLTIDTNSGVAVTSAPIVSVSLGSSSVEVGSGHTASSIIGTGSTATIIRVGTARSTGKAINAPLNSDTAKITIGPTIVILQQPSSSTIALNNDARFSVLASIGSSTGAGVPAPCIALIDETSPTQTVINEDWNAFRTKWPSRPFNIFRVERSDGGYSGVKLPSVSPTDYIVSDVARDDGVIADASDWFTLADLGGYVSGTTVTLWIDDSESMTTASVSASYDKFVADCAAAGLLIEFRTSSVNAESGIDQERYIWAFIDNLLGGSLPQDPNLVYQWKVNGENPVNTTTRTVSGQNTRIVTINDSVSGIHTVACSISYPGAVNAPLLSNVVDYDVAGADVDRSIIHLEEFDVNATLYSTRVVNLEDEALEINPSDALEPTGDWNRIYSINAPEEDVTVKITMKAAAGSGSATGVAGGEGGVSVWTMTLTQQQEYVVNLGARTWPSGGQGATNAGTAGGGSFFYQGGELLVACGGGGGGGTSEIGANGDGGGIGENASLDAFGEFPGGLPTANTTEQSGGRVARCTIGDYWANQGIAPCVSIGSTTFFTGQNGQKSTSIFTTPVIRGYKTGLNYQFNGGNGQFGGDGGGGGGAIGGSGGGIGGQGGAGGNGFASITIDSATVGGNTGVVGTIKIEKV